MDDLKVNLFHAPFPILRVSNLKRSLDYYKNVLGFEFNWSDPGIIASVSRNECRLLLAEGDQGHAGSWVWIGVSDTENLYKEYLSNEAKIRMTPTNFWWAYEMHVEDLDGNVLRFGSEAKKNEPYGPWIDMNGDFWEHKPNNVWEKINP